MVDHLVDSVAGYTTRYIEHVLVPDNEFLPCLILDYCIGLCTQKHDFDEGDWDRSDALTRDAHQRLGWCVQHDPWQLYFRIDKSVHCRDCDDGLIDVSRDTVIYFVELDARLSGTDLEQTGG